MNFGFNVNPFPPKANPSFNLIDFDPTPPPFIPNIVGNPFSPMSSYSPGAIRSFVQSQICDSNNLIGQLLADPWGGQKGECVYFVKACTGDHRATSEWVEGPQVRGNTNLQPGTPIAIFRHGKYRGDHAAIYEDQDDEGIHVVDQWADRPNRSAQPVHRHIIRWNGQGNKNGKNYRVIK